MPGDTQRFLGLGTSAEGWLQRALLPAQYQAGTAS